VRVRAAAPQSWGGASPAACCAPCRGAAPGRGAGEGETDVGEVEETVAGGDGEEGGCGGDRVVELVGARVAGVRREEQRRGRPPGEGPVPAARWSSSG